MRQRIVYTRNNDGGVAVAAPSLNCIRWMGCGGRWGHRIPRGWIDAQIERQVAEGRNADAARRFTYALLLGGCTTAEALAIIRDRDCAHLGYHIELIDGDELPDRWFRDAWRRSPNGGPVGIDLALARRIQWMRGRRAVEAENKQRSYSFDEQAPIEPDWAQIRTAIKHARDEEELRRVWPQGL